MKKINTLGSSIMIFLCAFMLAVSGKKYSFLTWFLIILSGQVLWGIIFQIIKKLWM